MVHHINDATTIRVYEMDTRARIGNPRAPISHPWNALKSLLHVFFLTLYAYLAKNLRTLAHSAVARQPHLAGSSCTLPWWLAPDTQSINHITT